MKHRVAKVLAAIGVLFGAPAAEAGGLDIPTLYTARHAGMGGTAIAGVHDASAVYNNPAGLGATDHATALADVSVFLTDQQTSPDYPDQNIKSGYRVGPAPFLAGAIRVHDYVALGLGAYPLGAVSGRFEYANSFGNPTLNQQTALAFEISPAVAIEPLPNLRFGLGYRITMLEFDRHLGPKSDPSTVDIDTFGANFAGFRLGAQWDPVPHISLGATYRHKISVSANTDRGRLLGQPVTDVTGTLVVPASFGLGVRLDLDPVSVAIDYDLIFNSQFDKLVVKGTLPTQGSTLNVPFTFNWSDSSTFKVGGQYRIDKTSLRAGYAWDGQFINRAYPSTFSSPPTVGHYFTVGAGIDLGKVELGFALVHRLGQSATIREEQIASKAECPFCGSSGTYASRLSAAFVDVSFAFDGMGVTSPFKSRKESHP